MMRPYFMRQLSSLWFDRYLIGCGLVMNLFAVVSVAQIFMPDPQGQDMKRAQKVRLQLEHPELCAAHFAGRKFENHFELALTLPKGETMNIDVKSKGPYGHNKEGHAIEMVEAENAGILFLETDEERKIVRCIPSKMADCVGSGGEYQKNGDCLIQVNLASDCQLMKGSLIPSEIAGQGQCRVPPQTKILRTVARGSCFGNSCKRGVASDKK